MASRGSEIQAAAVQGITALALSGAPTAVAQRFPTLPAGTEPPQIVVTARKRGATEYLTCAENMHVWDGLVTVFSVAGELEEDTDTVPGWLAAIAGAFEQWATWNGGTLKVTNFNDVAILGVDAYDLTAAGKTVGVATLKFSIETKEPK